MAASVTAPREITAAVVREKGAFELTPAVLDPPRDDEVLVRVVAAGLCRTDLVVRDQVYPVPLPVVLGHEGAGVVEAVHGEGGAGRPRRRQLPALRPVPAVSGRVTGRLCELQRHQLRRPAPRRFARAQVSRRGTLHDRFSGQSSFGTYAIAHERNTVKVRADAPLELLGPLGCGIQTGAGTDQIAQAAADTESGAVV